VQVVEHEQQRLARRGVLEQSDRRFVETEELGRGVRLARLRQTRDALGHRGHEPAQLATVGPRVHAKQVAVGVRHERPERLHERRERSHHLAVAAPEQHHPALRLHVLGQRCRQARLPHARLPGEQDAAALARGGPLPLRGQPAEMIAAPDEPAGGRGPRERAGQRRALLLGAGLPAHVPRRHRPREPLQLELADVRQLGVGAGAREHARGVAHEHLTAGRRVGQPRGLDHGRAEVVALLGGHVAARQADAHLERVVGAPVVARDRPLHGDRPVDRRGGARVGGHDPVAEVLDLDATGGAESTAQELEMRSAQLVRHRPERELRLRRSDQVGEQQCSGLRRTHPDPLATLHPRGYSRQRWPGPRSRCWEGESALSSPLSS
jgi:hypothetical protein